MKITRTDLKFLIPFLLYVAFGIWGAYTFKYVENHKALTIAFKWFAAPSIILGVIYSYYSVFKRGAEQAQWKKVLGLIALSIIFTLMFLRSSQGYLILWNAHFGKQDQITLKGTVSRLDYPKKKKMLNSYAIYIEVDITGERINLDVPTNDYKVGESFEKKMIKGSLGIIYSH